MSETDIKDKSKPKPHYSGHRSRLRERFLKVGHEAVADYELMEMVLFGANARGDMKPLAKHLLARFGSFGKVITADIHELKKVDGVSDSVIGALKVAQAVSERVLKEEIIQKPVIQSWTALLDYCKTTMAHKKVEELRILFLNHKNALIADEVQWTGTVNHTPAYPREVVKRALELGASAIILTHNHPSGDPTPSQTDIDMTKEIIAAAKPLNVSVHDHLVISEKGHYSFKSNGII